MDFCLGLLEMEISFFNRTVANRKTEDISLARESRYNTLPKWHRQNQPYGLFFLDICKQQTTSAIWH